MHKRFLVSAVVALAVFAAAAQAEPQKTYQATGPVIEVTDAKIVVQKGKENWEIARDAATKVTGELKVGAKVTIHYTMTAVSVEVKDAAGAKAEKKDAKKTE